ncbi:MAG TPA: trypsin-like peptidase domain-containing protein [Actinomycetota bacterium]|nr:trypsin-like peptidase domain-containing protein [Actinomycetota bacterium]
MPAFVLLAFLSLALLTAFPAAAQTTTVVGTPEERAAAIARPALFYTEQYFSAWVRVPRGSQLFFQGYVNDGNPFQWATRCSAFAVNPGGYLVTAGHCVDLGEEGARSTALELATQWLIDNGWAFPEDFDYWLDEGHLMWGVEGTERGSTPDFEMWVQRGVAAGGLQTGEAFPARVVNSQPWSQGDIAIVKIEQADLPVALIAQEADVTIGTEVLSIGYPGSSDAVTDATLEPTFKDGQINSEKTREGGLLPVYEMSAALSGGMSGGPTVNLDGEVVGVNSFNISGETEAFNFISPASLVTEMLAQNGVANVLGPVDEAYRAGLDAYFSGDYQGAIESFDQVLAVSPTHQQAQEYRVEASRLAAENPPPAEEAPAPIAPAAPEGEGFPVWAIALIAVGVVVVAGIVVLALRRRPAPVAPAVGALPPQAPAVANEGPPPLRAVEQPREEAGARFCSNCGQGLEPGARFCPACGHQVEAA